MISNCSESCGWIAAIVSAFSFGSFGVPIKSTSNLNVDPLVMQSYKTVVCFLTCWLVVPFGEPVRFTPLGIVSGIFWVPGATAGIYGIRHAGLAVSCGIWSAIIVMTSFFWGIFIFEEKVRSVRGACNAAFVLIIGLVGMSTYSEPPLKKDRISKEIEVALLGVKETSSIDTLQPSSSREEEGVVKTCETHVPSKTKVTKRRNVLDFQSSQKADSEIEEQKLVLSQDSECVAASDVDPRTSGIRNSTIKDLTGEQDLHKDAEGIYLCGGVLLNRRHLGIIGAIINGAWGGNCVIPMHYAKSQGFYGAGFLISYSCGSMIVVIVMWSLRYLFHLYRTRGDTKRAYEALPSFQFNEMWLAGLGAGSLYSIGNFASLIAVSVLGQGVGYSFIQTSMLISGLWGIFYFSEIQGTAVILKWMLSSFITVLGIIGLSYEHQSQTAGH